MPNFRWKMIFYASLNWFLLTSSLLAQAEAGKKPPAKTKSLDAQEAAWLKPLNRLQKVYVRIRLNNPHQGMPVLHAAHLPTFRAGDLGLLIDTRRTEHFTFEVDQVIDAQNMLTLDRSIWIEGVPTEGLTDEGPVYLGGIVFIVQGEKRYKNLLGMEKKCKPSLGHRCQASRSGAEKNCPLEKTSPLERSKG